MSTNYGSSARFRRLHGALIAATYSVTTGILLVSTMWKLGITPGVAATVAIISMIAATDQHLALPRKAAWRWISSFDPDSVPVWGRWITGTALAAGGAWA